MTTEEPIRLTQAEEQYLKRLNDEVGRRENFKQQARQSLVEFVGFLRAQHNAPADVWELTDIKQGFTRKEVRS